MNSTKPVRLPPDKGKPARRSWAGLEEQQEKQREQEDSTSPTPWRVVVTSRRGREITWQRFASRAGALAEVRLLHVRGVAHARAEGPAQ
jgi:hypothetical protein